VLSGVLGGAVYVPPVQRWAVGRVSAALEEKMGLKVDIDEVRLTPFLNLNVGNLRATAAVGDTLILAAVSAASPKESVVMYRNSSYIPVLKEKAAEITTSKLH